MDGFEVLPQDALSCVHEKAHRSLSPGGSESDRYRHDRSPVQDPCMGSRPIPEPLRGRPGTRRDARWDAKRDSGGAEAGFGTQESPLETLGRWFGTLQIPRETLRREFETLFRSFGKLRTPFETL